MAFHGRFKVFLVGGGCPGLEPVSCLRNLEDEKRLITFLAQLATVQRLSFTVRIYQNKRYVSPMRVQDGPH